MKTLLAILLLTAATSNAQLIQVQIDVSNVEFESWKTDGLLWLNPPVINGVTYEPLAATPIDPHFTRTPYGWQPSCPKGMTLVRHDPAPDCIWTGQPMNRKPVYGQFECVDTAKVMKLASCPAE